MGRLLALFTLCTLLLQISYHGFGQAVKVNNDAKQVLRLASGTQQRDNGRSENVSASMMLFFNVEELRVGNKIPFLFPRLKRAPNFISQERANSIPFSSKNLPALLKFFSIPPGSIPAESMRMTIESCESPPIRGETKLCATSMESMMDFVHGVLDGVGGSRDIEVRGTTHLTKLPTIRERQQDYNILSFNQYSAPRAVGCHVLAYPYAVYYCHHLEGGTKAFMTQLQGDEDGERVETAVLCHMDTSAWAPNHPSFLVLGSKPGTPVCHIFPEYHLLFITGGGNVAN